MKRLDVVQGGASAPVVAHGSGRGPIAVLSLHSHRDRSFLDDVVLHEISGALREAGLANDLVVACVTAPSELDRLIEALRAYPTVIYERVWSADVVRRLREALPHATLVRLRGEHQLSDAPADVVTDANDVVPVMADLLGAPRPATVQRRRPNLAPIYVAEEDRPKRPSFPIKGNMGCPYGADARENPLFGGVVLPDGMGRGCSFCTTGNAYERRTPAESLADALEQLRWVRREAKAIETLVLRDQNPFAWLTELVEAAEAEKLGPFTLLVESRADWWLQNEKRFERALTAARRSSIRLAPFLVGIENFSQRELDRFNKGISAEVNVRFLHVLRDWAERFAPAVDLDQGAFGFILFSPWTTLDDLKINLRAIEETRLHELRGRLLLSRARLYPDTALHHLAARDGLLAPAYASGHDDASARYGYLPAQPWRFVDPVVARVAELAPRVLERRNHRDELAVFRALLEVAESAPDDLTVEAVEGRVREEGRRSLELQLADRLVRARELPVHLPLFGIELVGVTAERGEIVLSFTRGRVRLPRPGDARVEPPDEPSLAPVAARLRRAITPARWESCAPLVAALSRSRS